MILNARHNLYRFQFPRGFFPKEIVEKYERYLKNSPIPFKKFEDFINHTIQSVTFPSLNADIVQQKGRYDVAINFRSGYETLRMIDRQFSVEFKHVDSFLNYFALMECFYAFHDFQTDQEFLPGISLFLFNSDFLSTVKVHYDQILYKSIPSALNLNYSDVRNQFKTFSVDFVYNNIKFDFDFEEE